MSENALGYLLNRAGYHGRHVPHGFRASFSIVNEWAFSSRKTRIYCILNTRLTFDVPAYAAGLKPTGYRIDCQGVSTIFIPKKQASGPTVSRKLKS